MPQPDTTTGPRRATEADIEELNELFSSSFTDRYRRDGLAGVRVPKLNAEIWRYAIADAGGGAMLWFDRGEMVAFNLAHHSGVEGWMGPLAVRPDHQGRGLGKAIVAAAVSWLQDCGAATIGLETMPRTVDNIGFYCGLGFLPRHLTMSLSRALAVRPSVDVELLGSGGPEERSRLLEECRGRIHRARPGYDFTREYALTHELAVGDTIVTRRDGAVAGVCLCHTAPLAANRRPEEVRVLKLFAESAPALETVLDAVEAFAWDVGIKQVSVRAQTAQSAALRTLQARGYLVKWTDLRMTLADRPEAPLGQGETMFSNWEI